MFNRGISIMYCRPVILICLILFFSGCAPKYGTVISRFEAAPIYCTSMKEFAIEPIKIGESKGFSLDEKSPAFQFDSGKSYFKTFLLPQSRYPYEIRITSYVLGDNYYAAYVFFPQILTLDENFAVIRSTDEGNFQLKKAGIIETLIRSQGVIYKLEGHVGFTKGNRAEKYLIILTTDELMRKNTPIAAWKTMSGWIPKWGMVAIPVGKEEVPAPHAPVGRIYVSVHSKDERR